MAKTNWKQAFAVAQKINNGGIYQQLKNELYARTPSDEYPFRKKSVGRFKPVDDEQKAMWQKLVDR